MGSASGKVLSDLDRDGLRGPVHSVIVEETYPGWTAQDGRAFPESTQWTKTEYDRNGRVTARWFQKNSVRRYSYTVTGHLLRQTLEINGKVDSDLVYAYDDKGRLKSITNSRSPDNPIAFRYDANGRKSKIAIVRPVDSPKEGAVSTSTEYLFETESTPVNLSEGGSAITLYDDHDRPTEIQTHDASGSIVSRTLRTYDEQGRVVEEKQTMDDPLKLIPAKDQKQMFDNAESSEELRNELAKFLGGSEIWSVKYAYDAQGRKTQTVHKTFGHVENRIDTRYNEHEDVAKEISQDITSGSGNPEADGTRTYETSFSYEYDSHGNWTVRKTSSRSLPEGMLKDSGGKVERTIEYY